MSDNSTLFRREVLALVHHVELHRSGWWDKALNRLVLASIWLTKENPGKVEIQKALHDTFGLTAGSDKLASILKSLEGEGYLVRIPGEQYRIPDTKRNLFENDIAAAEDSERKARTFFSSLVGKSCPDLEATSIWNAFEENILAPLIRDIGANTYHFILGERMVPDGTYTDRFIAQFEQKNHKALKDLITDFLDPQNEYVRSFITRMLHAQFCIEASGLSKDILEKLRNATEKPFKFRLFVDTNFLFSLLGLHENPSNASAKELKDLLVTLKSNPQVRLYLTPRTIDEAKSAISAAKLQVTGVPMSSNFSDAALHVGMSGMSERYFSERRLRGERLTPSDWFDPYLTDFVPMARAAGVELFNEDLDAYATRQPVTDDINLILNYEKRKFPVARQKSYRKVAHDMILWHFVKDKRPAFVESPIDAQEWILTVDFRLIGFDQHKVKRGGLNVPLCLHPTSLIQLLQFWVPRTKEFEEAILGGLRLPFLFQEFDAHAERVSLNIIKRLGRFEGSDAIPEETIVNVVMNDGLRSRIEKGHQEDEEIKLVRDALVEEMRLQAQNEKAKVEELTVVLKDKNAVLAISKNEQIAKDAEIRSLQERLAGEKVKLQAANENLSRIKNASSSLEARVKRIEEENLQRKVSIIYLGLLILLIALSVIAAWGVTGFIPDLSDILGRFSIYIPIGIGICVFVTMHLLIELLCRPHHRLTRLWPFRQVKRFRKGLWGIVIALLLSVAGSLIADNLQKVKADPNSQEQTIPPVLTDRAETLPEVGPKT